MSLKTDYESYLARREANAKDSHGFLWNRQYTRYVKPFQMFGNLYYVGCNWVCMHLVDTGDGLLLFDAGNVGSEGMLVQAIWELGFNPANVRWMVLSHGHVDHIGAASFFRSMYGTKLYLGAPDAQMFREHPEFSIIQDSPDYMSELFEPDVEIHDGDRICFGQTKVQFYLVPGHTDGCIAAFFDVSDGKETCRAGYYGGFGYNTLQKNFLLQMGDTTFSRRQIYMDSIDKVIDQKVDIFMGNHTNNNNVLGKREAQLANPELNPFIDPTEWKRYLAEKKAGVLELMADPAQN